MKILFIGGGSGGHVLPIVAIAREIRKAHALYLSEKKRWGKKNIEFFFLGPENELDLLLLAQEEIKVKTVLSGKIRRYFGWQSLLQNIIDVFIKIPIGIIQSFFYIFFLSPDVIFSKGGFGSIPGAIAGKLLFTPIFLHESDISPGIANKFLSGLSLEIFTSFPKTEYFPLKKIILVGNPIRKELLNGSKEQARELFKIKSNKPVILIMGGSQGAQIINDRVLEILPEFLREFEIIHQCGIKNFQTIKAESKIVIKGDLGSFYHPYPFLKESELAQAYVLADFIISRAGSGSIFEIAAAGKPSILIPLPDAAQDHQAKNAYFYQNQGACLVIEQNNFTAHFFLDRLRNLLAYPEKLEKMSEAAKEFSRPEAGRVIANYVFDYLVK